MSGKADKKPRCTSCIGASPFSVLRRTHASYESQWSNGTTPVLPDRRWGFDSPLRLPKTKRTLVHSSLTIGT